MRRVILVLAVLIAGCAMPGYGPPPEYGFRPERLLTHHLMIYGDPSDWFQTTDSHSRPHLSITWNCALDGRYHQAWYWLAKRNEDLPFGGCWVLDRHSSGRGICN